jgi:hypothetical protein
MPALLQRTMRRSATRPASRSTATHVRTSPVGSRPSAVAYPLQQVQRVAGNAAAVRLLRSSTSPSSSPRPSSDPALDSYVNGAHGSGRPLSASERGYFEPRFGADFGRVRLHADRRAAGAAAEIGARAFTYGANIHFAGGQFAPGTAAGDRLLAHELTHVVQQGAHASGTPGTTVQRSIGDGHDLESPRFKGDPDLEGCFDDEVRLTLGDKGKPGTRKVNNGTGVQKVQDALVELGRLKAEFATGEYNQQTWDAVRKLKKDEALGFETIGDVGPGTMAFLDKRFKPSPSPTCPPCPSDDPRPAGCLACPEIPKPGPRTPCERDCDSNFTECLRRSENPLNCIAQRSFCLPQCLGAKSKFEVCARLLQPPVEVSGRNHAYVETPTHRYAIITPCTSRLSFTPPSTGVAIKTDVSPDPCGRRPTCVECVPKPGVPDLEACFAAQFASYAAPSVHGLFGPNSNTFAGTLARACCSNMAPQPTAFGIVPGWDDPPAPAASHECPTGKPVC